MAQDNAEDASQPESAQDFDMSANQVYEIAKTSQKEGDRTAQPECDNARGKETRKEEEGRVVKRGSKTVMYYDHKNTCIGNYNIFIE